MRHFSRFSDPGFRIPASTVDRIVGNLGESLEFRDHDLDDEVATEHYDESQPVTAGEHTSDVVEGSRPKVEYSNELVCGDKLYAEY